MNRKKKINEILKKKQKKQNAKLHKSNKPRYISKAERAEMEKAQAEQTVEANTDTAINDSTTEQSE
ncbi:DUF2986 domain-containing protein [Vibrio ulleungensis]|jgi:hypothetical protein|uniref:DUF2986 domain-containing protein n=1 Tax=Vibrio ulleungensis TaxID=2807619 RepID=A0ABS2HJG0_9VIBR|nr:DUF2986 domain-containing protein [Vibrio ulleungensis]MBM7036242.1 DUF2986 domain-containing protein [Vibrio ulleungensis]